MEDRAYQAALYREVREEMAAGHRAVCLQLETGAGKTAIALRLALQMHKRRLQTLFIVHRKELLNQTIKTLKKLGLGEHQIGVIARDHAPNPFAIIQVAMIASLGRRIDTLKTLRPTLIIVDEAHHIRAKTWEKVIDRFPKSYLLGLTATPARLDGKGLDKYFTSLVLGPPMLELIEQGYLARVKTHVVPDGRILAVRRLGGDFNKKDLAASATGPTIARMVSNWRKIARRERTVFFCTSIPHSQETVVKLRDIGVSAAHVDGDTKDGPRDRMFTDFASGHLQALCNVEIGTEGVDLPDCSCVCLGRQTDSLVLYKQMFGRMMRPNEDGRPSILIDCAGNVERLGRPTALVDWTLEGGANEDDYKHKRNSITVRLCKECGFLLGRTERECPSCGSVQVTKTPLEVEVDLKELDEEIYNKEHADEIRANRKRLQRERNRRIRETNGDPEALEAIRKEYGYHREWVERMYEVYAHIWPKPDDAVQMNLDVEPSIDYFAEEDDDHFFV